MKRCLCGVHSLFLFEGNIRSGVNQTAPNMSISSLYYILFLLEMIHKGQNYMATGTLPNKFQRQQPCGMVKGFTQAPKPPLICWNPFRMCEMQDYLKYAISEILKQCVQVIIMNIAFPIGLRKITYFLDSIL